MRWQWPRWACAGLGFIWFLAIGGGPTLNPVNISWLDGDWFQHWLGFLFFIREPWAFPLGTISSIPYPIGTSIGFTDSNPLLALLLKPFADLLPAEPQFIGLWLGLCFVLQGYTGAALSSVVTRDKGQQILGGLLMVMSPVLLNRIGHDTLCAHWLLVGLLYLGLRDHDNERAGSRALWLAAGAALLSSLIHPYLAAMCWTLAVTIGVRLWLAGVVSIRRAIAVLAGATAAMIASFGLTGYFGGSSLGMGGFSAYSSDLLTLINPMHSSNTLPLLRITHSQAEGMGFLGFGGLICAVIATAFLIRTKPRVAQGVKVIATGVLLMAIFAFSGKVTFGGNPILDLMWLYKPFMSIVEPFRASGRFIWPLHYLVLAFGIWGVTRVLGSGRQAAATGLLAVLVALQAADMRTFADWSSDRKFRQMPLATYELARGKYEHLAFVPMQILGVCGDSYDDKSTYSYMLHAARLRLTFNGGYYARHNADTIRAACDSFEKAIDTGQLDPKTIYIARNDAVLRMQAANAACGRWDGQWICVARDSNEAFRTYIETGKLISPER